VIRFRLQWINNQCETEEIQGACKILKQISGVNSPQQNKEEFHINIWRGTSLMFADIKASVFFRDLKTLVFSGTIENEGRLYQRIFIPVKPFITTAVPLKEWDSPWSEVSMPPFVQVEDILRIFYEFWLDKEWQLNSCYILNMYLKCFMTVVINITYLRYLSLNAIFQLN
jgi:hypothetical protein